MATVLAPGEYFGERRQASDDASFDLNITQYDPMAGIGKHYHQNAYLSLLVSGTYREWHRGGECELAAGEVIFRPPGYEHANQFATGGGICFNLEIKQAALDRFDLAKLLPTTMKRYRAGAVCWMYPLVCGLRQEGWAVLSEDALLQWLAEETQETLPQRLPWLLDARKILDGEPEINHSLSSLAKQVFVHPVYLARAFKQRTGITVGEYQLRAKLRKAFDLVFQTTQPVAEIAWTCGFADAAHLVRTFKKYYGSAPGKFRSAMKG